MTVWVPGRTLIALALAAGLTFSAAPAGAQSPATQKGPAPVANIAEPLLDSVVNISTSQTVSGSQRRSPGPRLPDGSPFQDFFDDFFNQQDDNGTRPRRVQSLGSGFVIDESGIVVTNNHVIQDADEITVIFNDGAEIVASVIGTDEKTDIALLQLEGDKELTAVPFGDSEGLRVGDWVMAIGNPFGLGGSVTLGIVSARNRDINSGPYDNFIQTDAAINRGNSGGPLFNMNGEVVGINTAIISPTGGSIGIGFAVPAEIATGVIDQLRQFGETRRGWLGVRIQEVTEDIAEGLGMVQATGALVAGVTSEGPAEVSGIKPGDVILNFDGDLVDTMSELPRMVADKPIGKVVDVVVLRGGEEVTVEVTLGWLEDAERTASLDTGDEAVTEEAKPFEEGPFGLTLGELSDDLREQFGIASDIVGVLVADVAPGSPAEEKRFRPGDVIVEIAQERVIDIADVAKRIDALKADGRRSALFLLANKNGDLRFVAVRMD